MVAVKGTEPAVPSSGRQVFAAFLKVQAALDAITKDRQVTSGPARFAFRGVDDVMNALHKPMAEHGLICVPQVLERLTETRATRTEGSFMNVTHLRVRFLFAAIDGSTFYAEAWGEGQDSGDKSTGKAHSMAYKSALLQAFHIPTEVDTPDADTDTTPASPVQAPKTGEQFVAAMSRTNSYAETLGLHRDAGLLGLLPDEVAVPTSDGQQTMPLGEAFDRRLARLKTRQAQS